MARAAAAILLLVTSWMSLAGTGNDPRLEEADLAWDRGDYPAAIRAYLQLLDSPDGDRVLEPIALQTGELFHTIELTPGGGAPKFSPSGTHFTYEIGRGVARTTRLADTSAPMITRATLPGYGAAFSPDGSRLAYLGLTPTPEMLELERLADQASGTERTKRLAALAALTEAAARIRVRDIASGAEREIDVGRRKNAVMLATDGQVLFTGRENEVEQVFGVVEGQPPAPLTSGEPDKVLHDVNSTGTAALFVHRPPAGRGRGAPPPPRFGVLPLPRGPAVVLTGSSPAFSADGTSLAFVGRTETQFQLLHAPVADPIRAGIVRAGPERLDAPGWSPDGTRIVFQMMPLHDWELHVIGRDGRGEQRLTREIQHDVAPRFLDAQRLLGLIGEPRHRRSYLYDVGGRRRIRLFHNNTVRTIAPEYAWAAHPEGTRLLIVADRDGDTVSPERGVYLVDLRRTITREELRARLQANLETEESLRVRAARLFAPIAEDVRRVLADASTARIYGYQKALFEFDSKHISRPGNKAAAEYLFRTYKAFGYEPEYQWFKTEGTDEVQTANVIATLKGTVNPGIIYVVSSHYDSVAASPGADDDSSGTAALLEAARLLARRPQPATIVFASFTAEESGLLGSREFVRRALATKVHVAGALNNDMIGWANDHRLDSTIRHASPGIRDIQHAAAMQFTSLITYDARYFRNTDAHAYYEAYGDVIGGIGSYPVLGSPHYHQPHDVLETINHQLVAEVAKTTVATLMMLASSPSRLGDLSVERAAAGRVTLKWRPGPEKGVVGYLVAWGPPFAPEANQIRVSMPAATITAPAGTRIAVKAVNEQGLESWDWARAEVR